MKHGNGFKNALYVQEMQNERKLKARKIKKMEKEKKSE